ncbi:MAG: transcription elongation factor GreA [Candidatus Margulisbacteria bacterium]|nr:transcription elongation factor GreA [Candidatus Margulisiibacteriota bacterium]
MGDQMTKENYEKIKVKLEELKKKRAVISKTIGEAREHGDLKENSAYHTAKDEQGLNEMRIRDMEAKLANATIVDKDDLAKSDCVTLGSTVRIKALDTGQEFTYMIVSDEEADVLEDKISTDSPIGGALINEKIGTVVEVEIPRGLVKYKILEIK